MRPGRVFSIFALLALVTGCGRTTARTGATSQTHTGSSSTSPDRPLCDPAVPAVEDGALVAAHDSAAAARSDARGTGAWRFGSEGDCERVVLELTGPPRPARHAGPVGGRIERSYGRVRVALPDSLDQVAQADSAFASPIASAAYVVHGIDGRFYLDVHLASPALARLLALDDPARIAVDLSPGGGAVPVLAPHARNVVVIEPRPGPASYPLTIRGYGRTFEANVIARILVAGKERAGTFGTAADWSLTWGEFELTIPSGPSGPVALFVGELSARDGPPIGVTIPLLMR